MDKKNHHIYFWIHDKVEDTYLVAHNFSEFIMQFQFEQKEQINLGKTINNINCTPYTSVYKPVEYMVNKKLEVSKN